MKIKETQQDLSDEHAEQHRETRNLLSRRDWNEAIGRGKQEVEDRVPGKGLDELTD